MLDPVDETFFEFVEACLNHVQTPVLQRKFAALGGIDLLVRLCAMSMNDEVIIKACRALSMLMQNEIEIPEPPGPAVASSGGQGGAAGGNGGMGGSVQARQRPRAVVNAMKIWAAGGVSAVLAQMRRSRNDHVLQEAAAALKHLARVYEASKELPEWEGGRLFRHSDDAYDVLVTLFRRSGQELVLAEVAETVHYIALSAPERPQLVGAGAIGSLAHHCFHSRNPAVLLWVCNALCVLVMVDENRQRFTNEGGPEALVMVLNSAKPGEANWDAVVASAAHVLGNYMAGEGKALHDYQMKVGMAGGAEALLGISRHVVNAGRIEGASAELVEQCCAALCNLSFENDAHRVKLGELGACELFAKICQTCDISRPEDRGILEQACAGMGNICKKNRSNRIRIGACHGPETLAAVLIRTLILGSEGDAVAMQALRAVANVVMRNEENQERFTEAGGCRQLVQYCFATRDDAMLRWVLGALTALASHELIRYRLVNEGVLAAVAGAVRSAGSGDTKQAAARLTEMLPLPTPVVGSVILKEFGEEVSVQCYDNSWVRGATARIRSEPGTVTALSALFVQALRYEVKDVNLAEGGDATYRRRSPVGLTRIMLRVRDKEVSIDADLNGPGPEDIVIGAALLAKLKTLGFEHMVHEFIVL